MSSSIHLALNPFRRIDPQIRGAFWSAGWKASLFFTASSVCLATCGILSPPVAAAAAVVGTLSIAIFALIAKSAEVFAVQKIKAQVKKYVVVVGAIAGTAYLVLLAAVILK
jgi:hypothetical protein